MALSIVFLPLSVYTAKWLKEVFVDTHGLIEHARTMKELGEVVWTDNNVVTPFVIFAVIVSLPCIFYIVLKRYIDRLEDPVIQEDFYQLYADLSMFDKERKISYYPVFLIKRMVFVLIPAVFYKASYMQIQLLVMMTYAYIIFYAGRRPHNNNMRINLEIFNEVMFMILNYHMICFSNFNTDSGS